MNLNLWFWLQTEFNENWIKFPHEVSIEPNYWIWFCSGPIWFVTRIMERTELNWGTTLYEDLYFKVESM